MSIQRLEKRRFLEAYIHERYEEWFSCDPGNVVGVRVAATKEKDFDDLQIVFHVVRKKNRIELRANQKLPRQIPVKFPDGEQLQIPTSVIQTGQFQFQFQPGTFIKNITAGERGSFGFFLTDGDRAYLTTNFHVAALTLMARNQFFFNVDNGDGPSGLNIDQQACTLTFGAFDEAVDLALVDVGVAGAFANVLPDNNSIDKTIVDITALTPPFYAYSPRLHQYGYTINMISEDMVFQTGYNGVNVQHAMVADRYSLPGDSGSPVVDSNFRIAGILMGADNGGTYILPFSTINAFITKYFKTLTIL